MDTEVLGDDPGLDPADSLEMFQSVRDPSRAGGAVHVGHPENQLAGVHGACLPLPIGHSSSSRTWSSPSSNSSSTWASSSA